MNGSSTAGAWIFVDNTLCGRLSTGAAYSGTWYEVTCYNHPNYMIYRGIQGSTVRIQQDMVEYPASGSLTFKAMQVYGYERTAHALLNVPTPMLAIDVNDTGTVYVVSKQGYIYYRKVNKA